MSARIKAFTIHLTISAVIALAVIGVVFYLWYPAPLHTVVGVTQIFLILLAVDVVLGPLLTLLVYKVGKKSLVMDLSVIALLQLAALCYGLLTVAEGRPAWLVFAADRFDLVRVLDIDERKLDQTDLNYRQPSLLGPQWVAATNPTDSDERNDILMESVFAGVDIAQRPNLYQPLDSQKESIKKRLLELSDLPANNTAEDIKAVLAKHPKADTWLPLRANNQDMVVLMHKDTAEVVAIVDLRPWK
ncbi:type IV pilin accessory protein [Pseudomonas sp. C27(2019)]|uniref:TfpX/TfpZ family type IV pilin accessory protein n=1 Tax=Pseudomonas sp. C27(2019) TaxID=2604941 RepID=UPI0012464674|nr:TfpX/TfpZ family type IV pilin accessory protein [Pseudomonas sp. C27(2019)]QEY59440.1 type IV pilin accessory protein [Pseudomonas sp. C27(2019)]